MWPPVVAGTAACFLGGICAFWLGPVPLYLMLAGLILIVLGVIFRYSLSRFWSRRFSKTRRQTSEPLPISKT
jgi:Flp pilus assembly protein TadB